MLNIVNALIPERDIRIDDAETGILTDTPLFSIEKLQTAAHSLLNRKAFEPDDVFSEVMKDLPRIACTSALMKV